MNPIQPTYDLLTTASLVNRTGRQLVPALRALPAPMRRTCAELAGRVAETAEQRGLAARGLRVASQIDELIAACDNAYDAGRASAETVAQVRAVRDQLTDLRELLAWLVDQLAARQGFSPAPRR